MPKTTASEYIVDKHINKASYLKFIKIAKNSGYHFVAFEDIDKYKKCIMLRHDLDLDLVFAHKMVLLEYRAGVKSTFFVMLHNPLYNSFAKVNWMTFAKIKKLGHAFGLHFDASFYASKKFQMKQLKDWIQSEVEILSKIIDSKIYWISFHQPHKFIFSQDIIRNGKFESVYNEKYFGQIRYISDSGGRWREETIIDLVKYGKPNKIQFLSHPVYWFTKGKLLRDRFDTVIEKRKIRLVEEFKNCINNYEKELILY